MTGLVEETCRVRVARTPEGPATFYHWDDLDDLMGASGDPAMRDLYGLYQKSVLCGLPAFDSVDFGGTLVPMCLAHYTEHQANSGYGGPS